MTVLVTGAAGFVGFHVTRALLERGERVVGVDDLNSYYTPALKQARLAQLEAHKAFSFHRLDLSDPHHLADLAVKEPDIQGIFHFAAQAGVRHSLKDPYVFANVNVRGHVAVLEFARNLKRLDHLVYASSSSVYGRNTKLPFMETDPVDQPGSFYAVTKRCAELTSSTYSYLYGLPQTGLRFFTIYGPWGRPDMAYYTFARAIMREQPVTLYEGSALARDFTYIDDVVRAVLAVYAVPPATGQARLLNIGNDHPEPVAHMVALLERSLQRRAQISLQSRPDADVERTWASIDAVRALTGWCPRTSLPEGIERFVSWFKAQSGAAWG